MKLLLSRAFRIQFSSHIRNEHKYEFLNYTVHSRLRYLTAAIKVYGCPIAWYKRLEKYRFPGLYCSLNMPCYDGKYGEKFRQLIIKTSVADCRILSLYRQSMCHRIMVV